MTSEGERKKIRSLLLNRNKKVEDSMSCLRRGLLAVKNPQSKMWKRYEVMKPKRTGDG
jgi:hypothetical protein